MVGKKDPIRLEMLRQIGVEGFVTDSMSGPVNVWSVEEMRNSQTIASPVVAESLPSGEIKI